MFMTHFRGSRGDADRASEDADSAPALARPRAERNANASDLEAKLDRLFSELEELRREIRRQ